MAHSVEIMTKRRSQFLQKNRHFFRQINVFTKDATLLQPRSENYFRIEIKIGKKSQIFREIEALKIIE